MSPELSLSQDCLAALYNIISIYCRQAESQNDLKVKGQELAKATYYASEAVKFIETHSLQLKNVDALFGESFFIALSSLIDGQCCECQSILRAQRNDVVKEDAAFK